MKKYLFVLGLSFAAMCTLAHGATLKELKAEEKALKMQVKAIKESAQIEKTKANIIKLRDELIKLNAKENK